LDELTNNDARVDNDRLIGCYRFIFPPSIMIIVMSSSIMRWTDQLICVLEVIYSEETHLNADEIYDKARDRIPNISLGTVYRNLSKLTAEGLICEVETCSSRSYGKHPFTNAHFECQRCGRLICVPFDLSLARLSKELEADITNWSLRLEGICKECANRCI
jgi:Fur family peroxide stress response transcriptional regulator